MYENSDPKPILAIETMYLQARKYSCADTAWTDLVVKRSTDNGTTWSSLQVVFSNSTNATVTQIGNGVPLQLKSNGTSRAVHSMKTKVANAHQQQTGPSIKANNQPGTILLPFCVNNSDVFLTRSNDDGLTWSAPEHLPGLFHPTWNWIGLGPPGGIQLESGRILLPAYHTFGIRFNGQFTHGHTVVSDDGGLTWRLGATQYGSATHFSNEVQAVQLRNGDILVNARALLTHRIQAMSADEGETFGESRAVPELREPLDGCEGSTVINNQKDLLLYSGPNTAGVFRVNMTIWASPNAAGE